MRAKVCVTVAGASIAQMVRKAKRAVGQGADLVEFRLDMLRSYDESEVVREIGHLMRVSILKLGIEDAFERLLQRCSPAYFDLPVESLRVLHEQTSMRKWRFIASWHDYERTPETEYLERLVRDASAYGIPKVVTKAVVLEDNLRVLRLYRIFSHPLIAFCMGKHGILSRFLSARLGSPLIYSCLPGEEVAEGQPDLKTALEIREMIT